MPLNLSICLWFFFAFIFCQIKAYQVAAFTYERFEALYGSFKTLKDVQICILLEKQPFLNQFVLTLT